MAVTDAPADVPWDVVVSVAEDAGDLRPNPAAVPGWARPTLTFNHMAEAMRPHWHEGLAVCPRLAQQLLDTLDCESCTLFQMQDALEHMVLTCADMATHVLVWLQNCLAQPGADPAIILADLQARLQQMTE